MRGYEAVNTLLSEAGVETVFQYMAEDTMELVADLETNWEGEVVHSRHEEAGRDGSPGRSLGSWRRSCPTPG